MKLWHEAPSANFKVKPIKDMLIGSGISKLFSSIPTRSTIPVELRPRDLYQYETSYVMAYLDDVFAKLHTVLDRDSLSKVLKAISQTEEIVTLELHIQSEQSSDFVDDFSPEYLISQVLADFLLSVADSTESPRNKKAFELATKLANLVTSTVYEQAYADLLKKKVSKLR